VKNRLAFIAALMLGVLAILAIRSYVKRVEQEASARLKGTPVVAARSDLKEGAEITIDSVVAKEIPPQFIPPQAIQGSLELKQIIGRSVRVPVKAGQIILWSDLASERRGGLSALIPENEGAFSINISRGIQPLLMQPNDKIDIIASFTAPKPRGAQAQAQPGASWRDASDVVNVVLLQNVTVLAIGQQFGGTPAPGREGSGGGGGLTLSVTLPEAQLLMFASQHGELGAILRREGSLSVIPRTELPRVTFEEIEKIIGDLDQRRDQRGAQGAR
jgi:pilus assembly protein CpaB